MTMGSSVNSPNLTLSLKVFGYLDLALPCCWASISVFENEVEGPIFACDSGENFFLHLASFSWEV